MFTHKIKWYETYQPNIVTIGLVDNLSETLFLSKN